MRVNVIYSTSGFLHKNGGQPGQQYEHSFDSVDTAKKAPLPERCVFASISVEDGYHVHTPTFGWQFCPIQL
jgi:hypothetical protein